MLAPRLYARSPAAQLSGASRSGLIASLIRCSPSRALPGYPSTFTCRAVASRTQQTPRIDGKRMMETLHETCEIGKAHKYGEHPTETGMARLALNDDDKTVRLWLEEQARAIGCSLSVDQMGNMFMVRPGRNAEAAPVYMGSHLDTQLTGGRYDGILGIMAGLEALRTLHDIGYESKGPIGLVNWTNEEGARFPMTTMSSAVWSGTVPLETAWNMEEITAPVSNGSGGGGPQTVRQELERIGFLGEVAASHTATPMAAHFELHIEQGPLLEEAGARIGVVHGGQGYAWFEVTVSGRDSHAGTTPLAVRRDALLAAARMIVASHEVVRASNEKGNSAGVGVITTGVIRATPGVVNTIAREAQFTLDMRHPDADALAAIEQACRTAFDTLAREAAPDVPGGVTVSWKALARNPPVRFDTGCIAAVEQAAREELGDASDTSDGSDPVIPLWSGAGHDSCNTSRRCPTAMIFTPTRDGLSHTPTEYCSPADCVLGAQVLLGAVLRYDAKRDL